MTMRLLLLVPLFFLLGSACEEPRHPHAPYRIGVNHLRYNSAFHNTDVKVVRDLAAMGAQGMRHLNEYDIGWWQTYTGGDYGDPLSYDFVDTNRFMLLGLSYDVYAVPTLFETGPTAARLALETDPDKTCSSSPESDWCKTLFTPSGDVLDVRDADVEAAVRGYAGIVADHLDTIGIRHVEVGNELDFKYKHTQILWVDFKFSPGMYVRLLEIVDEEFHAVNPDIQIVLAGSSDTDLWYPWLKRVLKEGGGDFVDIHNLHFYEGDGGHAEDDWKNLAARLSDFQDLLSKYGEGGKPIWLTETGSSATQWSQDNQAEDVFRLFSIAFGNGVELVNWHTHISQNNTADGFGGYGLRPFRNDTTAANNPYRSYATYQLFSSRLGNFETCTELSGGSGGIWLYRYSGSLYDSKGTMPTRWVAWSTNPGGSTLDLSSETGVINLKVTPVVPGTGLAFAPYTTPVTAVAVGSEPVLIEESWLGPVVPFDADSLRYPWSFDHLSEDWESELREFVAEHELHQLPDWILLGNTVEDIIAYINAGLSD